jgi:hypothetical protein
MARDTRKPVVAAFARTRASADWTSFAQRPAFWQTRLQECEQDASKLIVSSTEKGDCHHHSVCSVPLCLKQVMDTTDG